MNTKDLAKLKAYVAILAGLVPIALLIIGYYVGNTDRNISEIKADIKPMIQIVSGNTQRLNAVEQSIERLDKDKHR